MFEKTDEIKSDRKEAVVAATSIVGGHEILRKLTERYLAVFEGRTT